MPRRAKPWFRTGRGWYIETHGKQVALGVADPSDVAGAIAAFERLQAAEHVCPQVAPQLPPRVRAVILAKELAVLLQDLEGVPEANWLRLEIRDFITALDRPPASELPESVPPNETASDTPGTGNTGFGAHSAGDIAPPP